MPTIINGDGIVTAGGAASTQGRLVLAERTGNGTNTVTIQAPAALASDLTLTMPTADGTNGQYLQTNGSGQLAFATVGDVIGPASSTDNAITRFDSTTGKLVQNSLVIVADDGAITAPQVGSIIPFYFANQAAFPSASTYHGAIAHSHADGAMYFAHGGVWSRLLDANTAVTIAQGGTGATTAGAALTALGAAASGANTDITALDQDVTITATGTISADTIGYRGLPQNSQTGAYTLALADQGKMINTTTGGVVIPANGSVAFPIGAAISIFNNSGSNQTISITTDTLRLAGTATTGSRTLAQYGLATCVKVAATTWAISGAGVT